MEETMSTCPLLRESLTSRSARRTRRLAHAAAEKKARVKRSGYLWLALLLSVARLGRLHQLEQLLNAIPDSNDDFGCF